MANIITHTEQFDDTGVWSPNDPACVVTPNTFAAPVFAGVNATPADTVDDTSAAVGAALVGTNYSIPADTVSRIASIFIRKDAISTRWPIFAVILAGGSGIQHYMNMDTSTGAFAAGPFGTTSPAFGVVDFDSLWWRLHMQINNDGTNNIARVQWWPSAMDALGGSFTSAQTGSAVFWGANMTDDGSGLLQTYIPDPFYPFVLAFNPFITTVGAKRF